jgi:hypothetical protein
MWHGFLGAGGRLLNRNTDNTDQMDFHGFFNHISAKQKSCVEMQNRIVVVQVAIAIGSAATEAK